MPKSRTHVLALTGFFLVATLVIWRLSLANNNGNQTRFATSSAVAQRVTEAGEKHNTAHDSIPPARPGTTHAPHSPAVSAPTAQPPVGALRQPGLDPSVDGPWADLNAPGIYREGEPAVATVFIAGRSFQLLPNQLGVFPRVYVPPSASAEINVHYPAAQHGRVLHAQMVDGGNLGGKMARSWTLDNTRSATFSAKVSAQPGVHRVILSLGSDQKTVEFWVGPPLPVRTSTPL